MLHCVGTSSVTNQLEIIFVKYDTFAILKLDLKTKMTIVGFIFLTFEHPSRGFLRNVMIQLLIQRILKFMNTQY